MINSFPFSRSLKIALASACLGASSSLFAGVPVNINTADAVELSSALDGVGAAKAEAIVAYRSENGSFSSAEDLTRVPGIGQATLSKNIEFILLEVDPAETEN